MKNKFDYDEFRTKFATEEQCLEAIKQVALPDGIPCPNCKKFSHFYPVHGRPAYVCKHCGHHFYPLAGTIFRSSRTPLTKWFFTVYLLTQSRNGLSAIELERHISVTYKTAWRMLKQLRREMAEDGGILGGIGKTVEADETFVGGKARNRRFVPNFNQKPKEVVMGMIERGGRAVIKHIPTTGKWELLKQIQTFIDKSTRIVTDEYAGYIQITKYGYSHEFVNHEITYVVGDVHTQNAECFWSHLKPDIIGTYRHVSPKHLQSYVDEFTFRYNHRHEPHLMFQILLERIARGLSLKTWQSA